MSLQSCPTCGYAVSTTTLKCRHCMASHDDEPSTSGAGAWYGKYGNKTISLFLITVSISVAIYLIFHFQKGGAF